MVASKRWGNRPAVAVLGIALALVMLPGGARADCNADLGALMQKRSAITAQLEKNKKTHAGKLDPAQACPQLRSLAAAQSEVIDYMTKNKDWCGLPDELLQKMASAKANMVKYSVQACSVAVKMKQMQEQAAKAPAQPQQQALKLPAGPL